MRARFAVAGVLLGVLPAAAARAGEVEGRVQLAVEGAALADVGPVAVFLESAGGEMPPASAGRTPAIHQRDAKFLPAFLIVAAGDSVRMENDDTIFHNVFSLSRPNDFDLGTYPAGEHRTVKLAHPGLVKLYCSIHSSMTGTILVVPTPWFSVVSASGAYRIRDVPPGRWELRVWNERLPAVRRSVTVSEGSVRADVALGTPEP
jgi:plastocyanin